MRVRSCWLLVALTSALSAGHGLTLTVSPDGRDDGAGNGSFASLAGARDAIRRLKAAGGLTEPITVRVAAGTYPLTAPLRFTPADSGTAACPITYEAAPGARPVLTGGVKATGLTVRPDGLWQARVPGVGADWLPEQMYLNGRHATRARTPNKDYLYTQRPAETDANRQVYLDRKDAQPLVGLSPAELKEVNLVAYFSWESARLRIASYSPANGLMVATGNAAWGLNTFSGQTRQRYQLENLRSALDEPGEWYLGRDGVLLYQPRPGDNPATAEIILPKTERFIDIAGDARLGLSVEYLTFRNLAFRHAAWYLPAGGHSDGQAEVSVDAAVMADGGAHLSFEGVEVTNIGRYAFWFREGCADNALRGCLLYEMGAGGVKIGTGWAADNPDELTTTRRTVVDNCIVQHGGWLHHGAHGIWIGHSPDNQITHNDVGDFNYTGISAGWRWGYGPSVAKRNKIEFNRIHHLGYCVLSDMGGVYTLGPSEGTTVSNNWIHDVNDYGYMGRGGWGLYNDEGSTGIVMENNLVERTKTGGYHLHYGKDLTVRNNIFSDARENQLQHSRNEEHHQYNFENNIVWYRRGDLFHGTWTVPQIDLARNVYWDASGRPVMFGNLDFAKWMTTGRDKDSVVADPQFVNAEAGDYTLRPGSPALKLGFKPFDWKQAGVYGDAAWVKRAVTDSYPDVVYPSPPPPPPPLVFDQNYEDAALGIGPARAQVMTENKGDSVGVVVEPGAGGSAKCLKVVDVPGLRASYDPHFFWDPNHTAGNTSFSFDIKLSEGSLCYWEWRGPGNPYPTGPSVWFRGGKLQAGGRDLADIPLGQWVRVKMTCGLGAQKTGTWRLVLVLPDGQAKVFGDLPLGPDFRELRWLGFSSSADANTITWLDNLKLESDQL
ncbi:MAG: right-handed parallel beta-helix repeat-containing protein [Armatimonadetes bacterium]|nr:right-handed parallel beta-helix repeat-containing protein [Armatimonadota bacterium]